MLYEEYPIDTHALTTNIVQAIYDTKAADIRVLELGDLVSYCERFVICSANSSRQVKAIADNVMLKLKHEHNRLPLGVEGKQNNSWILIDYDDVVVHILSDEAREYYTLDALWLEAPQIPLSTFGIQQDT